MKNAMGCLFVLLICPVALMADAGKVIQDAVEAEKTTAGKYFEALMTGKAETADALAKAPYYADGERLADRAAVKKEHKRAVAHVAQYNKDMVFPPYKVVPADDVDRLDEKSYGAHRVYKVVFKMDGRDGRILLYVSKGLAPKVIGYID